jgi:hypothetical protein
MPSQLFVALCHCLVVVLERQQREADVVTASLDPMLGRMKRLLERHGQHSRIRILRVWQHDRV